MHQSDWDRIQEIYHEALKVDPSERRAFVAEAIAGNVALAREVKELLQASDSLGGFLQTPIIELPLTSATDDLNGTTIDGRYLIERKLGQGGMGQVYLALDLRVNRRKVVLKFLSRELLDDSYALRKFKQEAEALSRIHHDGVVEVLDTGETNGRPYFVMQYVDGEALRSQISSDGMNLERAASILKQTGAALEHVHEQKVFHRDLKPENIMLKRGTDSVVLVDFGIAKVRDSVVAASTANRESAGTLRYMSPEQLLGETVTAASDVYSLAVVAYEMVTGRSPFIPNSSSQLLQLQRAGVKVKPRTLRPNLSPKAQQIILRGLAFKQQARYANAKQFGDELAQALSESGVERKHRTWLIGLLTVLGLVVLSFLIHKFFYVSSPPEPAQTANRSFTYFLTVQRMRDGQTYGNPIKSHGEESFSSGDRFQLTIFAPKPGYLYVFNEGPPEANDASFRMLFPREALNKGSASLGADQRVESEWMTFRGTAGAENFWIVWSASPVSELDAVKLEAFKHPEAGITGQTLETLRGYLTSRQAEVNAKTYNYKATQEAIVRGKSDLLVTLAQFKYR